MPDNSNCLKDEVNLMSLNMGVEQPFTTVFALTFFSKLPLGKIS